MTGADIIAIILLITILIGVFVYLLHWLYRHSSKDQSFVRTGRGGEKVVMGGGALVIPIVHDITVVNMNSVPIEIRQHGENSLTTKNKMRIDVTAEFFVRVYASEDAVSTAARTLGARTQTSGELKELIQGRFIDAMSSVAASMTMDEIHQNRMQFISEVSELVKPSLASSGLELETAGLTSLNQAPISIFDPSNHFDAEGLTLIVKETEERKKIRNQIENDTRVEIKSKDFEAEQRVIEIDRDLEIVRIEQVKDIESKKAQQAADIEEERSSSKISISKNRSKAEEEEERISIKKEKIIDEERIISEHEIKALNIQRKRDSELVEIASSTELEAERIQTLQKLETDRIESSREIKEAEIKKHLEITTAATKSEGQIENTKYETMKETEQTRIESEKSIELLDVDQEKTLRVTKEKATAEAEKAALEKRLLLEKERLATDEEIQDRDIKRQNKIKLSQTASYRESEDARVVAEREIEELRLAAKNYIERFDIEQAMETELADKERIIAIVNKAIEEAAARTNEAEILKKLASTEEKIETARKEEKANRNKLIDIIQAETNAERDSIRLIRKAEADKVASEQKAEGEVSEAKAAKFRYDVEAEGNRKLNEAENLRSEQARRSTILEGVIKRLPEIIREQVKPLENIDSIKIMQVDGLPGINSPSEFNAGGGSGSSSKDPNSISDQVVNSAMKYRTQVAFVDGLMEELGLPLKNIGAAGGMQFKNFPQTKNDDDSDD